ncbi:hypothetical protein NEOLEDRAFT_1157893 [Neolentinus lepideus HHB14362 ss-1]|uniref:Disintegrin and metalloproteinase domain-containing protein B n=1 Tax=Neolentinus lepideus HHB14362 ss-1 TaxID=1314782 RepID=A0A165Q949_9AGAM|nr:hypothetical protein NEOLEDRAFT_1157893 [Neolentinus lepideus HHB14362 ss-1]
MLFPGHAIHTHTLVVVFVIYAVVVSASIGPARPLKRITNPSTLALEILPRRPNTHEPRSFSSRSPVLRHSDTFRLTLSAFDQTYHLHLRPNDHLIHPAARVNYYHTTADGLTVLDRTEPLLRENVKVYWGEVVPEEESPSRMREDAAGALPRPSQQRTLGWARIIVHDQGDITQGTPPIYEGAFSVQGQIHHIMTKDNYLRHKHEFDSPITVFQDEPDSPLIIFRDSDLMSILEEHTLRTGIPPDLSEPLQPPRTCGHDSLSYNTDPNLNPSLRQDNTSPWYDSLGVFNPFSFIKRDDVAGGNATTNFINNIGQSAGCPLSQKVLYMGVAADCAYTAIYGTTSNATTQILNNWNMASSLYKTTFNVSFGIVELQVHNATCPTIADPENPWNVDCTGPANLTLNDRLSAFSEWRGNRTNDGVGLWHLMSGCPTGSEVGIAWLSTLCQQEATGDAPNIVSGTAVSTAGRTEWQVVSHEIGHNFGAICTTGCNSTSSCCPSSANQCDAGGQFVMNPTTAASETTFSPCSLGNICSLMQGNTGWKTNTSCLVAPNPSQKVISLQMCGNGIVEAGEDCDPGPGTNSTCCDSSTCKFTSGSVCDPANSQCCTDSCQFAPSTQVCRLAKDATCDTPEFCMGNNATCPPDVFAPNGKSCGSKGSACASGQCTSPSLQCQQLGASMNLQEACPAQNDKSCLVSCQDPTAANQCITLQTQLVDGSPCGYAGTCMGGNCKAGSLIATAEAWYTRNLTISVPVTVAAGIVFVFLLGLTLLCIVRSCRGRRNDRLRFAEPALKDQKPERIRSWVRPVAEIPSVLQPGSSFSRGQAPSMSRSGSLASRDTHGRSNSGGPVPPLPFSGTARVVAQSQKFWVDPSPWNGPPR